MTNDTELTKNNLVELILGATGEHAASATSDREVLTSSPKDPGRHSAPAASHDHHVEDVLGLGIEVTPRSEEHVAAIASTEIGVAGYDLTGPRLYGVSFEAPRSCVIGITGLLGSGVTELISIVAGSLSPTSGTLQVDGQKVTFSSPAQALRHGIGYLAGDRTTVSFRDMSVRENVTVSASKRWFGPLGFIRRGTERSSTAAVLDKLSVKVDPERPISTLSGGNQQRALVGRLIAADVKCLILNEPTVGVDIRARQTLWDAVKQLADGRTVIVASGEPEELVALCDRVICLRSGTVSAVLDGDEISVEALTHAVT